MAYAIDNTFWLSNLGSPYAVYLRAFDSVISARKADSRDLPNVDPASHRRDVDPTEISEFYRCINLLVHFVPSDCSVKIYVVIYTNKTK